MSQDFENSNTQEATLGGGCFWCFDVAFDELDGVIKTEVGYSGGFKNNPSYKEICTGKTGHAEVIRIKFNPSKISYDAILEVFWTMHDPTTLNRQGADVGTQYRSVIYYHSEEQKLIAEKSKKIMDKSNLWVNPIITEISPLINYFPAENYHQDYYESNQSAPYCEFVIKPKLIKFRDKHQNLLKNDQ